MAALEKNAMKMSIKELNVLVEEKGNEAAFVLAVAAEMEEWILEHLAKGTWDPKHGETTMRLVDKMSGNSLFSVKRSKTGELVRYEIHSAGGNKRRLDKGISLAEARAAIGKVIVPPAFNGHGVKTNVPKQFAAEKKSGKNKKAA